jgi:hypothetical protein
MRPLAAWAIPAILARHPVRHRDDAKSGQPRCLGHEQAGQVGGGIGHGT